MEHDVSFDPADVGPKRLKVELWVLWPDHTWTAAHLVYLRDVGQMPSTADADACEFLGNTLQEQGRAFSGIVAAEWTEDVDDTERILR